MRQSLIILILCSAAALSADSSAADRMINRESRLYSSHAGFSSLRETVIQEYDSLSGKLLTTKNTTVRRKDFFYKAPEGTVIRYLKNGEEQAPSDYTIHSNNPAIPICDIRAKDNYRFTEDGDVTENGIPCRILTVKPKMKTGRHFDGKAFVSRKDGSLVKVDGTIASLPIGVTRLRFIMSFVSTERGSVPQKGHFEVECNIPVIYPYRKIVTDFTASQIQLIN